MHFVRLVLLFQRESSAIILILIPGPFLKRGPAQLRLNHPSIHHGLWFHPRPVRRRTSRRNTLRTTDSFSDTANIRQLYLGGKLLRNTNAESCHKCLLQNSAWITRPYHVDTRSRRIQHQELPIAAVYTFRSIPLRTRAMIARAAATARSYACHG